MTSQQPLIEAEDRPSSPAVQNDKTSAVSKEQTSAYRQDESLPAHADEKGWLGHDVGGQPTYNRANLPSFVNISGRLTGTETALAAMQYLPTPVLVLSSLKTVVFANDAMGILLGLYNEELELMDGEVDDHVPVGEVLRGQSMSQIGIDLVQDGRPIWVNWETFLDNLADELDRRAAEESKSKHSIILPGSQHKLPTKTRQYSRKSRSHALVHDSVVDVVLSSQYIGQSMESKGHRPSMSLNQVQAKMVITIWTSDNQRYFTLSFSGKAHESHSSSRTHSRTVLRTPNPNVLSSHSGDSTTPSSNESSSPSTYCTSCGSHPSHKQTSPSGAQLGMVPSPISRVATAPSILEKISKMKDAILNSMEVPIFAVWNDESLALPNQAANKLMGKVADPLSDDSYDILSRFKAYTEDFSRQLRRDEYPIAELCRTQKSFKGRKIGYKDANGAERIFDVSGEAVFDERTEEFIVGLTSMKDVTEYTEKLKIQAEQSERQFELICDTMPQILWTSTPGGYHDWFSRRWYDYTGLTKEESLGTGWELPFHPEDMKETARRWKHSLATGDEYSMEHRCRRHDGAWRWMLARALPLRDPKSGEIVKWYGTCTDIHDQIEMLESTKRFEAHLCSVIKHAHVAMWTVDTDRKLTFLEGQLVWGLDENSQVDMIGRNIYEAFSSANPGMDVHKILKPVEMILAGTAKEYFSEHQIDGIEGKWFRTRFLPVMGQKRQKGVENSSFIDGVVGISFDVSELKRREADLRSQEQENLRLLSAETAAKEASRLKSQFLANMSHEIRTPIAGVIGMSELLSDTELDEDQMECVENIQRSANGLLTVINDILDLSKVESGRLDIEEVQFSLTVVIKDVCKMMAFAAERKNLTFKEDIRIGMQKEVVVLGDPGRCRQILTNLLTNSIKFTSDGYVKLSVEASEETSENVSIVFTVEDTGIGIEEEVRKRLFKPFSQADSSTARRFGGTGLGLTICRNLVELMHGEISLESVLGSGTVAKFWIPFSRPQFGAGGMPLVNLNSIPNRLQEEPSVSTQGSEQGHTRTPPMSPQYEVLNNTQSRPRALGSPSKGGSAESGPSKQVLSAAERQKTHILVVEDNSINQQIAIRTIRKLGFSVNAVWNGKEALDYLLREPSAECPRPDIILMDVQMPILDGYRATHLIRHHNPYSSLPGMSTVPIVAMTASAIQGDREKCERAGMDDYLAKPVKGKTLEKMLVKWATNRKYFIENDQSLRSYRASHDSNCSDHGKVPEGATERSGEPPAAARRPRPKKPPELENGSMVAYEHIGNESEGDRGLRRAAAEEKAERLRNEKLLQAAAADNQDLTKTRHQKPPLRSMETSILVTPSSQPSSSSPSTITALTEENMGRFGREQAEASIAECSSSSSAQHALQRLGLRSSENSNNGGSSVNNNNSDVSSSLLAQRTGTGTGNGNGNNNNSTKGGGSPRSSWSSPGTGPGARSSSKKRRQLVNRNNSSTSTKTVVP